MHPNVEIQVEIEAPPSRVFEALTRASELETWFAERAFVSELERRYDFWGRFTPETPDAPSGRSGLRLLEAPRKLAFEWRLRGSDTTVEIELDETARGTLLKLSHDAPPRGKHDPSIADFWLLSLENLRRFVAEGAAAVRCDYSSAPRGRVELTLDIDATRGEVFRALLNPEDLDRWMTARSEVEPFVGGRYRFGWGEEGPVKILELREDEKLAVAWKYGDDPETVVSWTLEGSGGRTRLTLVHSGFGPRETEDFRTGWLKHLLWLKGLLEQGEAWKAPTLPDAGCAA